MYWKVELNEQQTIVEARTQKAAIDHALRDYFGHVRATPATAQDIHWQTSMSGTHNPKECPACGGAAVAVRRER